MLLPKTLKIVLKKYNLGDTASWKAAQAKAEKMNKGFEETLINDGIVNETDLYEKTADFLQVPYISLKGKEIKKEILNLIPGPVAGAHQVVAFDKEKNELKLAMADPTDIQTIEFLRRKTGLEPKIYITSPGDLKEALHRYHAELEDDIRIVQDNNN